MTEPTAFQPVMMQDTGDCGIACLRTITGLSLVQVIAVFGTWKHRVMSEGLSRKQLLNAAKRLGFPLRFKTTEEVGRVVGIVDLQRVGDKDNEHLAVVFNGSLFDPASGTIWTDIDAFLKTREWKVLGIYVRRETKTE